MRFAHNKLAQGSGYTRLAHRQHGVGNQLGLQLSQIVLGWCLLFFSRPCRHFFLRVSSIAVVFNCPESFPMQLILLCASYSVVGHPLVVYPGQWSPHLVLFHTIGCVQIKSINRPRRGKELLGNSLSCYQPDSPLIQG